MTHDELLQALIAFLPAEYIAENEPMAKHTTFEVGGPADFFVSPTTVQQVADVAALARKNDITLWVVGCGSNLLVSDNGLSGIVLHLGENFSAIEIDATTGRVHVQAGATNEDVAAKTCAAGLAGYEFASGIPGTIGGAAIMNAGAYDGEFKDVGVAVECLTPEGEIVRVEEAQADWSYRHSMMMDKGWIVLSAELHLHSDDSAAIQARIDDLTERRSSKQPLDMPSAGSTFKRPEGYFAGPLIQEAGMQGHQVGGAMVSNKHAGFVVNAGGATAADVLQVIHDVQAAVLEHSGVQLEPEVRLWGSCVATQI